MARVQFVETVTVSGGPGGTLLPLKGIAATPYIINSDGTEGQQATAYVDRTSMTQPDSLVTDASGTVSFWLNSGDYNIHMDDQQLPHRIVSYIRGFTAPVIDTTQIIVAAQNLIQYTGDTKFSLQTADHGLKSDGTYEWILVTNDIDGGGRKIDHLLYPGIHQLLGSPTPDSLGMIRLPNISGRALIAAGAATGLSRRNLFDLVGEEAHTMIIGEMPNHDHTLHAAGTGISVNSGPTNIGTSSQSTGVSAQSADAVANDTYYAPITTQSNIFSGSIGAGQNGASPWSASANGLGWIANQLPHTHVISDPGHSHGINDPQHAHNITDPQHAHTLDPAGNGVAHNNIQPSACLNLFVKS